MLKIPRSLYPRADVPDEALAFDWIVLAEEDRPIIEVPPRLINVQEVMRRHGEESPGKCADSRARAAVIDLWLRPDDPYPMTVVEFNWLEGDDWKRAYGDFEDGYHRAERAIAAGIPVVFAAIREFRFMPRGQRPEDRTEVG